MIRRIRTIDAHAAGEPLRLIVDGFPRPRGATMLDKRAWVRKRHDRIRRALMREPRGHADMYGGLLTEPVSADADAGILFMHNEGYSTMCGHGVIAAVTIAVERGLLRLDDARQEIVLDAPAGAVRAWATVRDDGKVERVGFANVPSFVLYAGVPVRLESRVLPVDVAYGGAFYAIVDSEAAGLPIRRDRLPEVRALGMEIRDRVEKAVEVRHPVEPGLCGMYGTIFTGVADQREADVRAVTVFANGQIDRSPCGTGTAAVMAVIDAMGLLGDERPFVQESIIGTAFTGTVVERTRVGDHPAIVPRLEGAAWVTGEHLFLLDDDDPLRDGFVL